MMKKKVQMEFVVGVLDPSTRGLPVPPPDTVLVEEITASQRSQLQQEIQMKNVSSSLLRRVPGCLRRKSSLFPLFVFSEQGGFSP